ncbi:MAG: superoxide dismutase family protein [Candidatus Omnitrophica bacterium]|nr:superoxide dismutase family protein [Candidatus Omnitrophota bacterium]
MKTLMFILLIFIFPLIPSAKAAAGTALIESTSKDAVITGKATFEEVPQGLKIAISIANAPPGAHGIHIHENGSCAEGGQAAGGHFNPDGLSHGNLMQDGLTKSHAGDLGNIQIGPDGLGTLDVTIPGISLSSGKYAVAGKSVILHEKEDNFGQPTGNAGGRIACGVIGID